VDDAAAVRAIKGGQPVNVVDVVIVVLVVGAAVHGYLVGTAVQVGTLVGTGLGLLGGAALAPHLVGAVSTPSGKAVVALASLLVPAMVGLIVGRALGVRIWTEIRRARLERLDAVGGALLAAAGALLTAWLVASLLATAPARPLASDIQQSTLLRHLDRALPPAPSVFSRLQRLVDAAGLPQVFAQFEPPPAGPLPLPADPIVRAAVAVAGPSTVKISGPACNLTLSGSGFVAAPGLVVTNAHVIAGVSHPTVRDRSGAHPAIAIFFDPDLDIAVLRVPGLNDRPLPLLTTPAARGTQGSVLGYPLGGPFDAEPAVVLAEITAVGRNIYGQGLTSRSVYEVESLVRPGNSGGPLVRADGTVVGVVFSRSVVRNDIGYALTSDSVARDLMVAESRSASVSTGPCTAG
jgi:S1-C subfamily serine protease